MHSYHLNVLLINRNVKVKRKRFYCLGLPPDRVHKHTLHCHLCRYPFPAMCSHIHEFHHIITSSHFISLISSLYESPLTPYSNKIYIIIFQINYYQQHCGRKTNQIRLTRKPSTK